MYVSYSIYAYILERNLLRQKRDEQWSKILSEFPKIATLLTPEEAKTLFHRIALSPGSLKARKQ